MAQVIERASRLVDDATKISLHERTISDLVREADYFAAENGHETITRADVQQAVDAQIHRADRLRERVYEEIHRCTVLIDTAAAKVGQLNGLVVSTLGNFTFGGPAEAPDQASREGFVVRRILAAFGPATLSTEALEGAADLAARLGAELETLFVEDTALLEWTELPFVRQVSLHGLAAMPISQRELELQLRAFSADAQRRLAALAVPRQLRWSFRIARGQAQGEVVAAAIDADLLVLGSTSRPFAREALFEPSVRSLIGPVSAPVLLLRSEQPPPRGPVQW